jgi:hypothetical protein
MATGGGDLERALGALLAFDVGEIERQGVDFADLRRRPRQHLRAFELIGELNQRLRGDDLDLRRSPGRFRSAGLWTNQPLAARIGADRRRQHAGHRRDAAVEAELAQHGEAGNRVLDLHVDGAGFDALEGDRADALDHESRPSCYLGV